MENYRFDKNQVLYLDNIKSKIILNSSIDEIESGIIAPYKNNDVHTGGVFADNNNYIEKSKYIGDWFKFGGNYDLSKENIEYLDEDVVYLGFFINHWGHFLIDVIVRMWIIQYKKYLNCKFAFIVEDNSTINDNYYQFFELLGLSRDQIVWIDHPIQFKKVFIPSQGKDKDWNISREYLNFLSYVNEKSSKKAQGSI